MRAGMGLAAGSSTILRKAALACAAAVVAAVAYASPATAYIYWSANASPSSSSAVGRANLDGTGVNAAFAPAGSTVGGVAYNSTHIYWAGPNGVSRANIDGTGASLIYSGMVAPGLVIDSQYVYFFNPGGGPSAGNIMRANLDGSGVNTSFIPLPGADAFYLAIDSSHIYWSDGINSKIGRANLDGTGVNGDFITGLASNLGGVAVGGSYIYWANGGSANTVSRANLDGTGVNQSFITGLTSPTALAVDSNYIYWGSSNGGVRSIARANIDGSGVNPTFISPAATSSSIYGIAVSPAGSVPSYALSVTKAGTGSGAVSSSPTGIDCGATCSANFDGGTSVTLTAAPASGSTFSGWSGACSGAQSTCTVTMSQAQSVTATFAAVPSNAFKLSTVSTSGKSIRTRITVTDPGRIVQRGTRSTRSSSARSAAATVCSTSRTASRAGTYTLACKVNSATRKAQKKGPVKVLLRTTFTPTGGTARTVSRTVTLPSLKPRYTG